MYQHFPRRVVILSAFTRAERLQTQHWLCDALGDPEIVSVDAFTGVFAMTDMPMSTAHCWITRGLAHVGQFLDVP